MLGCAGRAVSASALQLLPWRASGGGITGAVGAVRTKKWKPFHNMYRANKVREIRRKEAETAQAKLEAAGAEAGTGVGAQVSASVPRPDEPRVSTTPFQATRLMRAFDVIPERGAQVRFWTKVNVDLTRETVRGTCHLPHGLATKTRVLAFCPDDEAEEMLAAGADVAGITEPMRRINQGWLGFDRCIATPAIMPQVMKIAKILGPKKLMPNPKSGTVVTNLKVAIKEAKGGTLLEFRAEGAGEVLATIADTDFSDAKVLDNMKFMVQTLLRAAPRKAAASTGGKASAAPLIGGKSTAAKARDQKGVYFMEATLQLGSKGPLISVDPESMLPASVGYFR